MQSFFKHSLSWLAAATLVACAATPPQPVANNKAQSHLPVVAASAAAYNQNKVTRDSLLGGHQLQELSYVGLRETKAAGLTTEYLVAKKGDTLYITFAGSNAKSDWLRNLHAQYKPYANSPFPVHQGFVLSWHEVDKTVKQIIAQQKPANIVLGGHSKGGAVAQVAALELLQQGHNVTQVVTLGAPPAFKIARDMDNVAFNQALTQSNTLTRLNIITTHYVREYDYIQLASTGLALNKRGVGKRLSLKDDGSVYSDVNRFGAVMGLVTNTDAAKAEKFDSTALHHHAKTYLEALRKSK